MGPGLCGNNFKHCSSVMSDRDEDIGNKSHLWISKDDDNITTSLKFSSLYDPRKWGASGWFMEYFVMSFIAGRLGHLSSCLVKNLRLSLYSQKWTHTHVLILW